MNTAIRLSWSGRFERIVGDLFNLGSSNTRHQDGHKWKLGGLLQRELWPSGEKGPHFQGKVGTDCMDQPLEVTGASALKLPLPTAWFRTEASHGSNKCSARNIFTRDANRVYVPRGTLSEDCPKFERVCGRVPCGTVCASMRGVPR
jgi:hypothetical protein